MLFQRVIYIKLTAFLYRLKNFTEIRFADKGKKGKVALMLN
jgi:hypothetical protein